MSTREKANKKKERQRIKTTHERTSHGKIPNSVGGILF